MKLKGSTIALLAIAILTAGGVYFWDRTYAPKSTKSPDGKTIDEKESKPIFSFKEGDITQVSLQTKTQTLKLEKTAKGWQIMAPKPGPADDGTVTYLLNLLATGTSTKTLQVDPTQIKEFGLDQPVATVDVQLKDGKTHQLILGKQTFDQSSVYAKVDQDPKAITPKIPVALVQNGFLDSVNRPLADWQAKPKPKASTSPLATPSPTGTPSSPPTTSPAPSASPQN